MSRHARGPKGLLCACLGVALLGVVAAYAQPTEVTGMVTEIKVEGGAVEVRLKGSVKWKPARPLMALRPGDAVRATEDAWAVVVLSGSLRSVRIDSGSSPFLVPALPAGADRSTKAAVLLKATLEYVSGHVQERLTPILVTRGEPRPPVIVTPHNCVLLPGPLVIEWAGPEDARATVRIGGTSGLRLERRSMLSRRLESSAAALGLGPGVRYRVQLEVDGSPPQETWFEVVDHDRALEIQQDLADLEQMFPADGSATSVAIIKGAHLMRLGLLHDAWMILEIALKKDSGEPALNVLLGDIYTSSGLETLAAESYQRAQDLLSPARSGR